MCPGPCPCPHISPLHLAHTSKSALRYSLVPGLCQRSCVPRLPHLNIPKRAGGGAYCHVVHVLPVAPQLQNGISLTCLLSVEVWSLFSSWGSSGKKKTLTLVNYSLLLGCACFPLSGTPFWKWPSGVSCLSSFAGHHRIVVKDTNP